MNEFLQFLGRFHPLVVHLPIGILMVAFLMELWAWRSKSKAYDSAIRFILLFGAISAAIASIFGYILSYEGGYDEQLIGYHFWAGIGTTVLAFAAYFMKRKDTSGAIWVQGLTMIFLVAAGHFGGSLTHGSDFLMAAFKESEEMADAPPPASLEEAQVFDHLIQPVLKKNCTSCHRQGKKKGRLILTGLDEVYKGGKTGPSVIAGNSANSELYKRITLPRTNKKAMPPKGKKAMDDADVKLIEWWITHAAAGDSTIGSLTLPAEIKKIAEERIVLAAK